MTQITDLSATQLPSNLPQPKTFDTRVSPAALQELFARDPEKLSDKDIQTIVEELRASRALFEQQEQIKSLKEPRKKSAKAEANQLTLDDLDL